MKLINTPPLSRYAALLLSLVVGSVLLTSCGKKKAPEAESITVARATVMQSLSPSQARSEDDLAIVSAVFEGLTQLRKGEFGWAPRPALGSSWVSEDSGESWLFQLTPERVFSDGTPIDAAAVAASLNNARKAGGMAGSLLAQVARVDASDEGLRITLSAVVPDLPARLAHPSLGIVSAKGLGSGPYSITEQGAEQVVLKANEKNPRPPAQFDRVVVKSIAPASQLAALSGSEVLATATLPSELAESVEPTKWRAFWQPESATLVQLSFNLRKSAISSTQLRQALANAINYQALPAVVSGHATPLGNYMPPALDGYRSNQRLPQRNLPAAKAVVEAMNPKPTLSLLAPEGMESLANMLVSNFAEAGATVTASIAAPEAYSAALAAGDYVLLLQQHTASSPSSLSLLLPLFDDPAKQGRENFSGYSDPAVWRLLDSASTSADSERRNQLLDIAIREINKQRPVVPLYSPHLLVAVASGMPQPALNPFLPAALPLSTLVREEAVPTE